MENKLQENFTYRGFRFTQVKRGKNIAIYLMENDVPTESKDYYFCYEVIKIKKQKAHSFLIAGRVLQALAKDKGKEVYYPEKEIYPSNKNWGLSGWTFKDFSEAKAYFINLTKKVPHSSQARVKTEDLEQLSMHYESNLITQ